LIWLFELAWRVAPTALAAGSLDSWYPILLICISELKMINQETQ
jgi:hypothetical protein